jgi:hypothetical protein
MLADDLQFEIAMLRLLGNSARPTGRPQEYSLVVPSALQGPGVPASYPTVTFRRSVALGEGSDPTEFIHRLHPLARAAATHAREQLSGAVAGVTLAPCVAVRTLSGHNVAPAAVFTFVDRSHPDGALIAVGIHLDGSEVAPETVRRALEADPDPGDVPWPDCIRAFGDRYDEMRREGDRAAARLLAARTASERQRRRAAAGHLRAEVDAFRADRIQELNDEEAMERAGRRDQIELFREPAINWAARRAAVATHADARLTTIAEWEAVPDPSPPEPLGILLVFPGERA